MGAVRRNGQLEEPVSYGIGLFLRHSKWTSALIVSSDPCILATHPEVISIVVFSEISGNFAHRSNSGDTFDDLAKRAASALNPLCDQSESLRTREVWFGAGPKTVTIDRSACEIMLPGTVSLRHTIVGRACCERVIRIRSICTGRRMAEEKGLTLGSREEALFYEVVGPTFQQLVMLLCLYFTHPRPFPPMVLPTSDEIVPSNLVLASFLIPPFLRAC